MNLPDAAQCRRGVCIFILGAAFALTLLFLVTEIRLLRTPSQRDYGEGHVLWLTRQILDPGSAYKPLDSPPYVVNPYTPLYMLTARLVNKFTGDLLMAGRALSLVSTFGIGLALAATVLASTPRRAPLLWRAASAAAAGVLPLLTDTVSGWCSLMRVDMLALFLMYAGLGVYIAMGKRERWQHVAGVFLVLALFTKETMLSAPLACLTFGLLVDRRRAIRFGAGAALLLAAGAMSANTVTHGGFLTHILTYNRNPFSWKIAAEVVYSHLRTSWAAVAIAAAAFLAIWNSVAIGRLGWKRVLERRAASPYGRAVILAGLNCAFATGLMATAGKMGTNYNHFLAWDISTGLLSGLFLYRLLATWTVRRDYGRATAWVYAVLLFGLLLPSTDLLHGFTSGLDAPESSPGDDEVLQFIRQSPGPVFSENLLLLTQADQPVTVEPATLTYLALAGHWDEQPYVALFARQYFSLIVAYDIHSDQIYTPAVTSAIESDYALRRRIGPYSLYYPRANMGLR
jgi:hypothetical protein